MEITLDPATEERIQRELARGHYGSPAEVIARPSTSSKPSRNGLS